MKKLLSLIAAGAIALGLIGCSGDLHDEKATDMSTLFLRGNFNSYGTTELTAAADGTYTAKFVANNAESQFAIATADGNWSTAYRKTKMGAADADPCAAYTAADVTESKVINLYHGGGMSNATIETTVGTEYTVTVTPGQGYMAVSIAAGEAAKDAYISINGEMIKMDLLEKGSYKYAITEADSTSLKFEVLYDGAIYGVADDAVVAVDADALAMTSASGKVPVEVTVDQGEPYNILLDTTGTEPKVVVEFASYKAFITGDFAADWKRMSVLVKGTKLCGYTFTYTGNETGWGGHDGIVNYKIKKVGNWVSDGDNLMADCTPEVNGEAVSCGEVGSNNIVTEGLEVGSTYTVILNANDEDDIICNVIGGSDVLYLAGSMNGWSHALMCGDDNGAYYEFEEAGTYQFKVCAVPAWEHELFKDSNVTATETVTEAGTGSDGNATVTAAAGDKMYVYKKNDGKYYAKLVSAN